jgi:hypothetical protein
MANFLIGSAGVTVDGTTSNDTFEVITGASAVTVNGLAGDDSLKLSAFNPSDSLYTMGDGEDTFTIATSNATGMDFQSSTIRGGIGEDTINVGTYSSEINSMEVRGNEGNDTLNLSLTNLDGTASSIDFQGNEGNDTILVSADANVYDSTIGGGKGADDITFEGGTFNDSTLIGGFGTDTATADMTVKSSLIQLGNGTNDSTDSADTLVYSGVISNSTVKGGAGGDTITMQLVDNSTATIIEGNLGNDTINISAAGDYESTEFRLGAGADTLNLSGDGAGVSADIFGGLGNDDINFSNVSGIVVEGGAGADAMEYEANSVTYRMGFGDSTDASMDTIGAGAVTTGGQVIYQFNGEDLTIQSSETVTAVVGSDTSEMVFTGGNVFFGGDAAVTDVTAAVAFLDAGLGNDEAASFSLATSRADHAATDEFYLFVKGVAGEDSVVVEMTDVGVGNVGSGRISLSVADTFSASTLTFEI